jgi:hypothetical protein
MAATRGQGIVDRKVGSPAEEETVKAGGVLVVADDLAQIVDAGRKSTLCRGGIIKRDEGAAAEEETVTAAVIRKTADDLAGVVDTLCNDERRARRPINRGVGADTGAGSPGAKQEAV